MKAVQQVVNPFKNPGLIEISSRLFVEMSAEAEKLITEVQFFTGINDSGCGGASGYEVFDHVLDYVVQDDQVFREALQSEMYSAMLDYLYGTEKEIEAYCLRRVNSMVQNYRVQKTLSLFDWEVVLRAMHSFINNGCSKRTEFVFELDEYPSE